MIDEIHTLVGAGGTEGGLDAANILKPALARGELQCIGATTLDEYRQHIERDAALGLRRRARGAGARSPRRRVRDHGRKVRPARAVAARTTAC